MNAGTFARRAAGLLLLLACLASCGLFVSFAGFDASGVSGHAVGGAVDGLEGGTVTVTLNGAPTTLTRDGGFVLGRLPEGAAYAVEAVADQRDRACFVERGSGTIAKTDVTDVAVRCGSNTELVSLVLSAADLAPAFDPKKASYTSDFATAGLVARSTTTTVTAVARAPGATIEIDGQPVTSGAPSAPIRLAIGALTQIDVKVTAPGGGPSKVYLVGVTVVRDETIPPEYVKASSPQEGAEFGASVALSGDTLVVGAPGETDAGRSASGAVYVFRRIGGAWTEEARLVGELSHADAFFGASVALSGDVIVVGAPGDGANLMGVGGDPSTAGEARSSGAAYVFTRVSGSWTQRTYIKASNSKADARFGASVALSGDTFVVGAPGEKGTSEGVNQGETDFGTTASGAAYVFVRAGASWAQQAYLKPSNTKTAAADAVFGTSVAISGDTVAVGAPFEASSSRSINGSQSETDGYSPGAAYVFVRAGGAWSQQAYVKASNTHRYSSEFGASIALEGDRLVVGAPFEPSYGVGVGGGDPAQEGGPVAGGGVRLRPDGSCLVGGGLHPVRGPSIWRSLRRGRRGSWLPGRGRRAGRSVSSKSRLAAEPGTGSRIGRGAPLRADGRGLGLA